MQIKAEEISQIIRDQIKNFDQKVEMQEVGTVITAGDGIAKVYGLDKAMAGELVEFPGGVYGIVFNLEEDNVGIVIMGEYSHIREGDTVKRTGQIASVPVGRALVGRVVNPLGQPIDGKGPIETTEMDVIELTAKVPSKLLKQTLSKRLPPVSLTDSLFTNPFRQVSRLLTP